MKVGVNVTTYNHGDWERLLADDFSRPPAVPDATFIDDTLVFGELVEPLGFDSIWTTEHFGSAYSMQPNPLQWLAYWAGRTERVDFGTAVVVAPWWNPVRLAHELAMLDLLLKGRRLMVGLGRGVSEHEYAALGVPREHAREIFYEVFDILRLADQNERFSYDGTFFKVPPTSIRPQPRHKGHLLDGVRAAFQTRASAEMAAEAGFGQLFVANEPLEDMAKKVQEFNEIRTSKGFPPDRGTAVLHMYCAETEEKAEAGYEFLRAQTQVSRYHYFEWNNTGFDGIPGYEEYAEKLAKAGASSAEFSKHEASRLIGTPDTLIEKIHTINDAVGLGYIVLHASYGGMTLEHASNSLRLFAQEVLPAVHAIDVPEPSEELV